MNESKELWFITGSQHLYGSEVLKQVHDNSKQIVQGLNESDHVPLTIIHKPPVKTRDEVLRVLRQANNTENCIGVICWMHTFSPAKMWINGLNSLEKPLCHLHTQFNSEIPWNDIDMDFMNLNQSAHGDREFGFILSRMRIERKIVVGHWKDKRIQKEIGDWQRVVLGWDEMQHLKVARIGDNMREVAVTEGDKVEAQIKFGVSVNGYDSSDIINHIEALSEIKVKQLIEEYEALYLLSDELKANGSKRASLIEAARIELGLESFLKEGGFGAFTDTFENLGQLKQLPGIAVQRLMYKGFGFGAEGDWKTAALLRVLKVMSEGLPKGTSFMEDYTNHFSASGDLVMGSHMLEICPSISKEHKPSCEIHPLSIGGKEDPVRLVFNSSPGPGINVSLIDLGNRFRLVVNEVEAVEITEKLPKLPVARVLWKPSPDLNVAASAWMLAGGAHHTVFTQAISTKFIEDFAEMAGIECLVIDENTKLREFKNQIRTNEMYYHLAKGI